MSKLFKSLLVLACIAPLSACGEGYIPQLTNSFFPYGNERTAGSGVAYVIARMAPEKNLKIVPVTRAQKPTVIHAPEPQPALIKPPQDIVKDMQPVFRDKMIK